MLATFAEKCHINAQPGSPTDAQFPDNIKKLNRLGQTERIWLLTQLGLTHIYHKNVIY